jgi:type II secretory pathway pseudopilin PulG
LARSGRQGYLSGQELEMKISVYRGRKGGQNEAAATLVEVLVGSALLGILFTSLFGGISMSTAQTRIAREDLRATQILIERLEGIRLFDWYQLVYSNNLCPATFTSSFAPGSSGGTGIVYYGTMSITNVSLNPPASYTNQLRAVIVSVVWTNGNMRHQRSMSTYQAQYGMQNYVFNN